jgi:hypothetical protein
MYGNTNPGAGVDPSNGLYGAGRFAYSTNQFSASVAMDAQTGSWADVDYKAELSASAAAGEFTTVTVVGSTLTRPDYKGVRAFVVSSGSSATAASTALLLPEYTSTDGTNITFVFTGSVGTSDIPVSGSTNFILNINNIKLFARILSNQILEKTNNYNINVLFVNAIAKLLRDTTLRTICHEGGKLITNIIGQSNIILHRKFLQLKDNICLCCVLHVVIGGRTCAHDLLL